MRPWQLFGDELSRWADSGRTVEFWWRDDDAALPAPPLRRLTALAAQFGVPLGLAAIPHDAVAELFESMADEVEVLQHGYDHRNRAAAGEKAAEFTAGESSSAALDRIAAGYRRLRELAGARMLPVMVPPWNRIPPALVQGLAGLGLRGLSTFAPRTLKQPARGLLQVNTHVDLIAWRGDRGFVGVERALSLAVEHLRAKRGGSLDGAEPTGWLTHHAVHDEATWAFLLELFERTCASPSVRWLRPSAIFAAECVPA